MARAIIYTRVSTDGQEENYSLPSQLAACCRYADQHGMTVVAELSDVMSGAKLERPGLTQVRDLLRVGAAEVLIVYSSDRLSRAVAHMLLLRDELRAQSVTLHVVSKGQASVDTPEGNLFDTIESAFAEYERLKIRERVNRGKRSKVESGKLIGSAEAPYGYAWAGEPRSHLVVVEAEAATVRDIITRVLAGESINAVHRHLCALRIPSPGDTRRGPWQAQRTRPAGEWSRSGLYYLLRNPVYAGTFYACGDARIPVPVPAIVERTTWEALQHKLATGKQFSPRNAKRLYLLRGRIRCQCGHARAGRQNHERAYYVCCRANNQDRLLAKSCHAPAFRADAIEGAVWHWIATQVLDEDRIRAAIADRADRVADDRARLAEAQACYYRKLTELDDEAARAAHLYIANIYTIDEVAHAKAAIDAAREATRAELTALDQQMQALTGLTGAADDLCHHVRTARAALDAGITDAAKRQIIDLLDMQVRTVVEDDVKYIDVLCRLTQDVARLHLLAPDAFKSSVLKNAELVQARRNGQTMVYSLNSTVLQEFVQEVMQFFNVGGTSHAQ